MDNKEFAKQLEERTKKFAINVIRLSVLLPNSPEGKILRNQLTKAGTSVGANYREANRARSKADFKCWGTGYSACVTVFAGAAMPMAIR